MSSFLPYSRLNARPLTPIGTVPNRDPAQSDSTIGLTSYKPHQLQWQATIMTQQSSNARKRHFAFIKGWWLELGSALLAFAIMLVTVVLLAYYNEKPLRDTPRTPSLNTLVNIFSTIEAALLVFIVAEVLSQAKWRRFRDQAPLDDFNVIDNASRGIRGSVQVLFRPRLGLMSLVGALVTIVAIAIGPMLQETIVLKSAWRPNSDRNATAPISKFFAPPASPLILRPDPGMKGVVMTGLSSYNSSASTPNFGCPSGNCTFDRPYSSLAVCHTCQKMDVKPQCNFNTTNIAKCNYTLGNGHHLDSAPMYAVNISTAYNSTSLMTGVVEDEIMAQYALVRASIISETNGPLCKLNGTDPECMLPNRADVVDQLFDGGTIGAMCDLALCVNTYVADITEARATEKVVSTYDARDLKAYHYAMDSVEMGWDPVLVPETCYIEGLPYRLEDIKNTNNATWTYVEVYQYIDFQAQTNFNDTIKLPIECVFAISRVTYSSLIQFMSGNPFFLDAYGMSNSNTGVGEGVFSYHPGGMLDGSSVGQTFGVDALFNNGNASFDSIDEAFGRLATAMSTYLRQNSRVDGANYIGVEAQLANMRPVAQGVLYRQETIVNVQWYWLILPLVALLVTCIYLGVAMIQGGVEDSANASRAKLWKSNALVPLIIGYNSRIHESIDALNDHGAMQTLKQRQMTLGKYSEGWAFAQAPSTDVR